MMPTLANGTTGSEPVIDCGVVPTYAESPADALSLVGADGAAIVSGVGPSEEDARSVTRTIFGSMVLALPEAAAVFEGGEKDTHPYGSDQPLPLHSDGFAYGLLAPDYFLLSCVRDGDTGGESVLVDGYAMLNALSELDPELHHFALNVAIDQTEPGMHPCIAPLVSTSSAGRMAIRTPIYCEPSPESTNPDGERALIARWFETLERFRQSATRFRMNVGDLICIDNYRFLHSRNAYTGPRKLWRVWVWTTSGNGVPEGLLHSDARYAGIN